MARVVVIGAGISGLVTAEWLRDSHDVVVLEAGPRAGGNVWTHHDDGHTLEQSANGFLDNEPALRRLFERLGLSQQVRPAADGPRYIFHGGQMVPVPTSPPALVRTPLLPWWAKLRLMLEPFQGIGEGDESIHDFATRRLGRLAAERLVGTMVLGIWAGDSGELSLPACFPKMRAMEEEHGSLIRAMLARRADPSVAAGPPGHLTSFQDGLRTLTEGLAERLDVQVQTPATGLEAGGSVRTPGGAIEADAIVLACPGHVTAELLHPLDPEAAGALSDTPYVPVAVVCTSLPREGWEPPEGFGCLVARAEGLPILGTLFTSNLFPDHAPADRFLVRSIVGGALRPALVGVADEDLIKVVGQANEQLLGPVPDGARSWVFRHPKGIPQYTLGHLDRVRRARGAEARHPGLFLTGNHLDGVAVKDCVRDGERVAQRVAGFLARG